MDISKQKEKDRRLKNHWRSFLYSKDICIEISAVICTAAILTVHRIVDKIKYSNLTGFTGIRN